MPEIELKTKNKVNTIAVTAFFGLIILGAFGLGWILRNKENMVTNTFNQSIFTLANETNQASVLPSCTTNTDCPANNICYSSVFCGLANTNLTNCNTQIGDLQCHQSCTTSADCSAGQDCLEVTLWHGANGGVADICL